MFSPKILLLLAGVVAIGSAYEVQPYNFVYPQNYGNDYSAVVPQNFNYNQYPQNFGYNQYYQKFGYNYYPQNYGYNYYPQNFVQNYYPGDFGYGPVSPYGYDRSFFSFLKPFFGKAGRGVGRFGRDVLVTTVSDFLVQGINAAIQAARGGQPPQQFY